MTSDKLKRALDAPRVPIDEAHRARLEERMLAAYDARSQAPAPRRASWLRYAVPLAVAASLITATQAPAEVLLDVGLEVRLALSAPPEDVEALGHAVSQALAGPGERPSSEVGVRIKRRADGPAELLVTVWGPPRGSLADAQARVRQLPGLAATQVQLVPLRGRVRDTVLGKFGRVVLRRSATPAELQAAKAQLLQQLRSAEGEGAEVDVDIEQTENGERVKVKVKRQRTEP